MEENRRWKFDEEEWKDKFDKAFDKALETWRLSWTDGLMDHQTTATKKWGAARKVHSDSTRHSEFDKEEVNNVEAIWKLGYAVKVFDKSPERALEEERDKEEVNNVKAMCQLGYAVKVCDGSPDRVFTSTGTQPDFSPHLNSHFNGYAKFGKGNDVGGYGEVNTNIWGSYKDGGSGGGPGQGRIRTLALPRFDRTDSNGWIMRVEQLLYVYNVSERELLEAVEMAFVGDVLRWYQWENKRRTFLCWSELKMVILRQFSSSTYQNLLHGSPSRREASQNLSENQSIRGRTPTPERIARASWLEDGTVQSSHELEKREYVNNVVLSFDSSESSSHCSSNASIKMVDRYIDGEQVQACNVLESHSSQKSQVVSANGGGTCPPRVQYTKSLLVDGVKQKPKSHSFRETKGSEHYFSTKDWVENGFEHESPRKLAKHGTEKVFQSHVFERASAREELRLARTELGLTTRRLEKEKSDLQLTLEKELDKRSNEWSFKLEKFQVENHRLRDKVRELAEQNVSLQREVSTFCENDIDSEGRITSSEQQLHDQTARMEELGDENQNLQQHIMEIQEKYKVAQEDHDCIRRNDMEKDKECKDLHKSITRMLRTCSEQEKTITGLREGLREEIRKKTFVDNFDSQLGKLQMELMRLTESEHTLRNEAESFRREADPLRHENISLLNRLKGSGKEYVPSVRLDQDLLSRVCCSQNQGPGLLNECVQLCMTLLEHLKEKVGQSSDINQDLGTYKNGLDGQYLIESDRKLHGFKRGAENLIRSLPIVSSMLQEKVCIVIAEPRPGQTKDQNSKDDLRSELRVELLLTSLLRDKLHSQELDIEQLHAELATAVQRTEMYECSKLLGNSQFTLLPSLCTYQGVLCLANVHLQTKNIAESDQISSLWAETIEIYFPAPIAREVMNHATSMLGTIIVWLWYDLPRKQWRPGEEQDEFQDKVVADEVKIGLLYACGRKEIVTWERSRDLNSDLEDKVVLGGRSNVMHWSKLIWTLKLYTRDRPSPERKRYICWKQVTGGYRMN